MLVIGADYIAGRWRRKTFQTSINAVGHEEDTMLIGKPGEAVTAICTAEASRIEVRGRDLTGDLMGRLSFTEFFYLSLTGQEASDDQRFFLDLLLVAIAEHGLTPTVQAARMTYDAAPDSLQGALAAGLLGCGPVVLGTAQHCGEVLVAARAKAAGGLAAKEAIETLAREMHAKGEKMPGFGHPVHRPVDPRAERILTLADERKVSGPHVRLARLLPPVVAKIWGKPLPMNVSMPIAAVLLDLDFPSGMIKAIPLLARAGGILAHLAEEQERPIGFLMASKGEASVAYRREE
jgi:citrate synthase